MNDKKYTWHKIADNINDINFSANGLTELRVAGKTICMTLHNNILHACTQKCPHAGGILSDGYLDAAGNIYIADQSNYGLGWRILLVPNGKKIIYHNGWWHGNRSVFIRLLDEDALIVILSNSSFTTISNSRKLADLFGQYKQTGKSIVNF